MRSALVFDLPAAVQLLGRRRCQGRRIAQLHVKLNRIEIESVRPSWSAHLDEYATEVVLILEGLDHGAASVEDIGQIAHAFSPIRES